MVVACLGSRRPRGFWESEDGEVAGGTAGGPDDTELGSRP